MIFWVFALVIAGILTGLPSYWIRLSWKRDLDDQGLMLAMMGGTQAIVLAFFVNLGDVLLSGVWLGQTLALALWGVLNVAGRTLNRPKELAPEAWREGAHVPLSTRFSIASIMAGTAAICAPLAVARTIDAELTLPAAGGIASAVFPYGAALIARTLRPSWGMFAAVVIMGLVAGLMIIDVLVATLLMEATGVFAWQTVLDRLGQGKPKGDDWSAQVSQEADR